MQNSPDGDTPSCLGMGAREGWPEIADFNDNIIRTVLGGTPISLKAQELVLDRAGTLESAWMDLDYTPVPDESGAPAGVLVFVSEITDRLLAERRAADEAVRQRQMLQQMPGFAAMLSGPRAPVRLCERRLCRCSPASGLCSAGPFARCFRSLTARASTSCSIDVYAHGRTLRRPQHARRRSTTVNAFDRPAL